MSTTPFLKISDDVETALAEGRAVVALESTIITHGMPFPQNLEMARSVEALVRKGGGVPATVTMLDGAFQVGLTDADLTRLAEIGPKAAKASRRDVAALLQSKQAAGTTVATTMMAAEMAGIQLFATGGIGGVHRGAEQTFDISADLEELSRTPVAVVCAGAKAILDIPKTLEVLETKGVPVVTLGQDDFPAFWSRSSGLRSPLRLDSPDRIAAFQRAREAFGIAGGMLIGNPVPARSEIPSAEMEGHIAQALARAETQGIVGKAVTPFLLASIFEITGGRSLTTNIALVENNARLAAQIAVALARAA